MSLKSRLFNLIAPESSSHLIPTSQEAGESEDHADGEYGTDAAIARKFKRMHTVEKTPADEDFDLKRPPYLHVHHPATGSAI